MWKLRKYGTKSRMSLLSLVLALLLSVSPCFSEVVLTDEEVREMLMEMEESKKELEDVKTISTEQKQYYEELLNEARKEKAVPWIVAGSSNLTALGLIVLCIIIAL